MPVVGTLGRNISPRVITLEKVRCDQRYLNLDLRLKRLKPWCPVRQYLNLGTWTVPGVQNALKQFPPLRSLLKAPDATKLSNTALHTIYSHLLGGLATFAFG